MKKIITIGLTLLFTSSLYAETYTYNQLLQSAMGIGEQIELQVGDIIDFENGHTITIQDDNTECKAFGMTLKEMDERVKKLENQNKIEYC